MKRGTFLRTLKVIALKMKAWVCSEEFSDKRLATKTGVSWWQLLQCGGSFSSFFSLEKRKQRLVPGNTRDISKGLCERFTNTNLIAFQRSTSVFLPKSKWYLSQRQEAFGWGSNGRVVGTWSWNAQEKGSVECEVPRESLKVKQWIYKVLW